MEDGLVSIEGQYYHENISSKQVDLTYDSFTLKRNIVDYRDIQLLLFFNRGKCQFLMNIYIENLHTTIIFLSNKALNISSLY